MSCGDVVSLCLIHMNSKKLKLTPNDLNEISNIISPIIGQNAWGVKLGYGSFITANFGSLIDLGDNISSGEWHLWIRHSYWRLEKENQVLVASEDDRVNIEKYVSVINGLKLDAFEINPSTLETFFSFSEDVKVVVTPTSYLQDKYDYWLFFTATRNVLTIGPGIKFSYENADKT